MSENLPVVIEGHVLEMATTPQAALRRLQAFQTFVKEVMHEDEDYGTIPGTPKPTLLKPGAEKLCELYNLGPKVEITSKVEQLQDPGYYSYEVKCSLFSRATGELVGEGVGSCNSKEARYRWRWLFESELPNGINKSGLMTRKTKKGTLQYRIENDDLHTLANTILKMAKKRALVDVTLSVTRSSGIFTQDMEDLAEPAMGEATDNGKSEVAKGPACPTCEKGILVEKQGTSKAGKEYHFWGCSEYPKCKHTQPAAPEPQANGGPSPKALDLMEEIEVLWDARGLHGEARLNSMRSFAERRLDSRKVDTLGDLSQEEELAKYRDEQLVKADREEQAEFKPAVDPVLVEEVYGPEAAKSEDQEYADAIKAYQISLKLPDISFRNIIRNATKTNVSTASELTLDQKKVVLAKLESLNQ